jgi:hypothetical protein
MTQTAKAPTPGTSVGPHQRWVRVGGAIGVVSMVLLLVSIFAGSGTLINTDSSATQIVKSLGSDPSAVSNALAALALSFFVWFAASLAHTLHRRDPATPLGFVVLAGAVLVAGFGALDNVMQSVLIFVSKQNNLAAEPALTRVLYHFYNGLLMPGLVAIAIAVYLAGVGLAALMGQVGRRWLGWVSVVFVPLALISGLVGLMSSNGGLSPVAPFGILGFVFVTLITSISLVRERPRCLSAAARGNPIGER